MAQLKYLFSISFFLSCFCTSWSMQFAQSNSKIPMLPKDIHGRILLQVATTQDWMESIETIRRYLICCKTTNSFTRDKKFNKKICWRMCFYHEDVGWLKHAVCLNTPAIRDYVSQRAQKDGSFYMSIIYHIKNQIQTCGYDSPLHKITYLNKLIYFVRQTINYHLHLRDYRDCSRCSFACLQSSLLNHYNGPDNIWARKVINRINILSHYFQFEATPDIYSVRRAIDAGASVHGFNILHATIMCQENSLEFCKILLEQGADPLKKELYVNSTLKINTVLTPLELAEQLHKADIVSLFKTHAITTESRDIQGKNA